MTNNAPPISLNVSVENSYSMAVVKAVDALDDKALTDDPDNLAGKIVASILNPQEFALQLDPEVVGETRDGQAYLVFTVTTEKGDQKAFEAYWRDQKVKGSWELENGKLRTTVLAKEAGQLKAEASRLRKIAEGVVESFNKEYSLGYDRLLKLAKKRISSRQKKVEAESSHDAVFAAAGIKLNKQ